MIQLLLLGSVTLFKQSKFQSLGNSPSFVLIAGSYGHTPLAFPTKSKNNNFIMKDVYHTFLGHIVQGGENVPEMYKMPLFLK